MKLTSRKNYEISCPTGEEIPYFFLGWEEFYNINSYNDIYFHIIFREINCQPKIVWIYVIKFFSPQKKYEFM